jgi:hypothetical protein
MSRRLPLFTLRASVRTVLAEAGDKGATLADIEAATGADRHSIQRALGGAREKFAAPITSKLWRHFATEAQRDAWVTSCAKPTRVALSEAERKTLATNAAKRAAAHKGPLPLGKRTKPMGKPGADLVVPGGTVSPPPPRMPKPAAQPIITSATRVTVAPTPLPRFHVPDDFKGAFSLAGVGRDVQTWRGWA